MHKGQIQKGRAPSLVALIRFFKVWSAALHNQTPATLVSRAWAGQVTC